MSRRNPGDDELRRLERDWRASGDPQAARALLTALERVGAAPQPLYTEVWLAAGGPGRDPRRDPEPGDVVQGWVERRYSGREFRRYEVIASGSVTAQGGYRRHHVTRRLLQVAVYINEDTPNTWPTTWSPETCRTTRSASGAVIPVQDTVLLSSWRAWAREGWVVVRMPGADPRGCACGSSGWRGLVCKFCGKRTCSACSDAYARKNRSCSRCWRPADRTVLPESENPPTDPRFAWVHKYVSIGHYTPTPEELAVRNVALAIKHAEPAAIAEAARAMAPLVRPDAVLVPVPDSKGGHGGNVALCEALVALGAGVAVAPLVRRTRQVPSSTERRRAGVVGLTADEHVASFELVAAPPTDRPLVLIDNVATTGNTMIAVARVLGDPPGLTGVAYAAGGKPGGGEGRRKRLPAATNPPRGDEHRRDVARRAAQGDPSAIAELRAERARMGHDVDVEDLHAAVERWARIAHEFPHELAVGVAREREVGTTVRGVAKEVGYVLDAHDSDPGRNYGSGMLTPNRWPTPHLHVSVDTGGVTTIDYPGVDRQRIVVARVPHDVASRWVDRLAVTRRPRRTNPPGDEGLRDLERRARGGDPQAAAQLHHEAYRRGRPFVPDAVLRAHEVEGYYTCEATSEEYYFTPTRGVRVTRFGPWQRIAGTKGRRAPLPGRPRRRDWINVQGIMQEPYGTRGLWQPFSERSIPITKDAEANVQMYIREEFEHVVIGPRRGSAWMAGDAVRSIMDGAQGTIVDPIAFAREVPDGNGTRVRWADGRVSVVDPALLKRLERENPPRGDEARRRAEREARAWGDPASAQAARRAEHRTDEVAARSYNDLERTIPGSIPKSVAAALVARVIDGRLLTGNRVERHGDDQRTRLREALAATRQVGFAWWDDVNVNATIEEAALLGWVYRPSTSQVGLTNIGNAFLEDASGEPAEATYVAVVFGPPNTRGHVELLSFMVDPTLVATGDSWQQWSGAPLLHVGYGTFSNNAGNLRSPVFYGQQPLVPFVTRIGRLHMLSGFAVPVDVASQWVADHGAGGQRTNPPPTPEELAAEGVPPGAIPAMLRAAQARTYPADPEGAERWQEHARGIAEERRAEARQAERKGEMLANPPRKDDSRFAGVEVSEYVMAGSPGAHDALGGDFVDVSCVRCGSKITHVFVTNFGPMGGDCLATLTGDDTTRRTARKIVDAIRKGCFGGRRLAHPSVRTSTSQADTYALEARVLERGEWLARKWTVCLVRARDLPMAVHLLDQELPSPHDPGFEHQRRPVELDAGALAALHPPKGLAEGRKLAANPGDEVVWRMSPFPFRRKPFVSSRAVDRARQDAPVLVPLDRLWGSQRNVTDAGVEKWHSGLAEPVLVYAEPDGTFTIADGHHRAAAAHLRGEATILAHVVPVQG